MIMGLLVRQGFTYAPVKGKLCHLKGFQVGEGERAWKLVPRRFPQAPQGDMGHKLLALKVDLGSDSCFQYSLMQARQFGTLVDTCGDDMA